MASGSHPQRTARLRDLYALPEPPPALQPVVRREPPSEQLWQEWLETRSRRRVTGFGGISRRSVSGAAAKQAMEINRRIPTTAGRGRTSKTLLAWSIGHADGFFPTNRPPDQDRGHF